VLQWAEKSLGFINETSEPSHVRLAFLLPRRRKHL